ncbi:MAG: TetR/AcrR family transcriptional regulator [Lachnospiraceae bacterium]|nr:TetR/AcrR family transcriptional regulator [Lachnospiraceae bacterium]MDY4070101.1 TetR/AcrR family transcriptional regulator [Lachnospiraceae bacterium]
MNEKFFDLKKEKQDRMINAALKLFAENGYRRASTDDMVKEAGISKGLLFHYFGSKLGLYEFVYDYSVKFLTMELSSVLHQEETDFFVLRGQIEQAKAAVMKNFPYVQLFLYRASKEDETEALTAITEKRQQLRELYDSMYSHVDESSVAGGSPDRIRRMTDYTLNGLLEDLLRTNSFSPEGYLTEAQTYLDELQRLCGRTDEA